MAGFSSSGRNQQRLQQILFYKVCDGFKQVEN
jgi:hypothetical protein